MVSIPFSSRIFNTQSCELPNMEDEMHKKRDEMKTIFRVYDRLILL